MLCFIRLRVYPVDLIASNTSNTHSERCALLSLILLKGRSQGKYYYFVIKHVYLLA